MTGMRWFSISSCEEVQEDLVGAVEQPCPAPPASPRWRSRARRRTRRARGSRPARPRTGRAARAARRACPCSRADLEQRAAVYLGELLHQLLWRPRGQAGEVELAQRLLDQAPLVGVVERLARDLLGRHDRQVGDLAADVVERPFGGGVDVALGALGGFGEDLLAALAGLVLVRLGRLARALDDLLGLGRWPPSGARGIPRAPCRPPRGYARRRRSTRRCSRGARRARRGCAGRRPC